MAEASAQSDEVTVRCTGCGREWFGLAAAEAMAALGHCIRCRGQVVFPNGPPAADEDPLAGLDPGMKPHQVLGTPRY